MRATSPMYTYIHAIETEYSVLHGSYVASLDDSRTSAIWSVLIPRPMLIGLVLVGTSPTLVVAELSHIRS